MPELIGTQAKPFDSTAPMKLAMYFLAEKGQTEKGGNGLILYRGNYWGWEGRKWVQRDRVWLENQVYHWLDDAYVEKWNAKEEMFEPVSFPVNRYQVAEVVRAVDAYVELDAMTQTPCWLPGDWKDRRSPGRLVAFEDMLVDCDTGETIERDETWFDSSFLPCKYEPEAECPRWMQCLEEWSKGEEVWKELLQRMMGYCLMSHREYAKMFLLYGKIRGGKGTIVWVLETLIGKSAFFSSSLWSLVGGFGLDGLQSAKVLSISEYGDLKSMDSHQAGHILKSVVGQDPLSINIKHQRQLKNVVCNAVPLLQSNEVPRIANRGRGLSSKMVILPFGVSFERREQFDLKAVLAREMAGIAAWAVKGAMRLEAEEDAGKKWPIPAEAVEVMRQYHLSNNGFDSFLEELFVPSPLGFVSTAKILELWKAWEVENGVNMKVPYKQLTGKLLHESSWDLSAHRQKNGGPRGIKGMSLKLENHDG